MKNPPHSYTNWQLIKDLRVLIKPYFSKYWLGIFIRLTSDLVWLYPAFALAKIVDFLGAYEVGDDLSTLWVILIIWVILSFYHYPTQQLAKYLVYQVAENSALDSEQKSLKHLFLLDVGWHERESSGNKLKRIQNGSYGINRIVRISVDNLIEIGVNFFGMIFILGLFDFKIAAIIVFFLFT